jgi:hypothetical protein
VWVCQFAFSTDIDTVPYIHIPIYLSSRRSGQTLPLLTSTDNYKAI